MTVAKPRDPYRVFVSSTYREQRERRQLAIQAIRMADMVSVVMEDFVPRTQEQAERCIEEAAEADVVVAILGWRYGWVPDLEDGRSITELEIDAAKSLLVLLIDEDEPAIVSEQFEPPGKRGEALRKLDELKQRLSSRGSGTATATFTEKTLQAKILKALWDWRADHEHLPTARPPGPDAERSYREFAFARHSDAPLLGFPKLHFEILLTDLHVEVTARIDLRHEAPEFGDYREAESVLTEHGDAQRGLPLKTAFADAEERGRQGMVLLGEPGSGKTTHLQRVLLWCLAPSSDSTAVGLPAGYLPVLLPLSAFRHPERGFLAFVRDWLAHEFAGLGSEFPERVLRREKLLLLLDGLDELPGGADPEVAAQELKNVLRDHPTWRALVTCRYAGYRERHRLAPRYLELHLPTFTPEQTAAFVCNWFGIVERQLQPKPADGERVAEERSTRLLERFRDRDMRSQRMSELRSNPLLLAVLCLVFRDEEDLPRRRSDLYERCVEVLIRRWTDRGDIVGGLDAEHCLELLRPLALWMHEARERRVPRTSIESRLQQRIAALDLPDLNAAAFLDAVREDCGLLTGWSDEHFGFLHLGLQEHLASLELAHEAAGEARRGRVVERLARELHDDWWQEVILLTLGQGGADLFEPLMLALFEHPAAAEREQLFRFALEEAARPSPVPFERFLVSGAGESEERWASQLLVLRLLRELDEGAARRASRKLTEHPLEELRMLAEDLAAPRTFKAAEVAQPVIHGLASRIEAPRGGYELVLIPAGTLSMGSSNHDWEKPEHEVVIESPFYMGKCPVTNEEYARFLAENPGVEEPEYWGDRQSNQPRQPVVGVSWEEAQAYCKWAGLVLPTEAQWEYACRGGTKTRFWSGDEDSALAEVGWYVGNSEERLHTVGEKSANSFGLFDVHGNVLEWCQDTWSDNYRKSGKVHPKAYESKVPEASRVVRGGSVLHEARDARSASRSNWPPGYRIGYLGFRPARVIEP